MILPPLHCIVVNIVRSRMTGGGSPLCGDLPIAGAGDGGILHCFFIGESRGLAKRRRGARRPGVIGISSAESNVQKKQRGHHIGSQEQALPRMRH